MSKGTFDLKSDKVTELYQSIIQKQPDQEHWSLDGGGFAAVIKKRGKTGILIYHFARSIKPLARIVEGGGFTVMRDYYTEDQLLVQLEKLHEAVSKPALADHTHKGTEVESFHSSRKPANIARVLTAIAEDTPREGFKVGPDDYLHPAGGYEHTGTKSPRYYNEGVSDDAPKVSLGFEEIVPPYLRTCVKLCDPHRQ